MAKKIFTFIFILIGFSVSFGSDTNYYEYADIPGTDLIEFNAQVDNKTYKISINTGEIDYISGSDNKLHSCFPLEGTGYTKKLGEIYFQYENKGSYICTDNKLRGVFKIGAGGWGHMEDIENNSEKWKLFINKTADSNGDYYHSSDGNNNGTGQSRLDGIGYANWNNARTTFNIQDAFSNVNAQVILNTNGTTANGYDTGSIIITLKYKNGDLMKNFKVDSISFITGYNSDVKKNWDTIAGYKYRYNGNLQTDNNGQITGEVIPYVGGNKEYGLKIKIQNNEIIKTGNVNFRYPFDLNLYLTGDEIDGKELIGYNNKVKITTTNINSHITNLNINNVNGKLNLGSYKNYFNIITGENINGINNNFNLKILGDISKGFYSGDIINLDYSINGDYTYKIGSNTYKINNFNTSTNFNEIYKYGKVAHIDISKLNSLPYANGKQVFWYDVKFLNKNNYPINHLNYNLGNFTDSSGNFDLDDETNTYETGFFITGSNTSANINGIYKIGIISYKSLSNAQLTGIIKNLKYNGNYSINSDDTGFTLNNISFKSPVGINFENKILKAQQKDNFKVNYSSDVSNLSNPGYNFTGYIQGCSDCIFSGDEGKNIGDNSFENKTFNIYISGSHTPNAVIYTGYYSYNLDGNYGNKSVKNYFKKEYSPIIYIKKGNITIIGQAGSDKKILGGVNYVSIGIKPYIMKNLIKKHVITSIRGSKQININNNKNIDLSSIDKINIFKCGGNKSLNIYGHYNGNKQIISLGCKINIYNNITTDNGELEIFSYKEDNKYDFNNSNGWKNKGNIYINNNVNTIQASLYTNGSILTYINNIDNGVFTGRAQVGFKKQLYIYGKVFSRNTLGGGTQDKNLKFSILGGKKINNNDKIFNIYGYIAAQAYDINFWRTSLFDDDTNTTYNTGNISPIIYNKYNCTGKKDIDTNNICSASIIIQEPNTK